MDAGEQVLYLAGGWRRGLPSLTIVLVCIVHLMPVVAAIPVMPDLPLLFLLVWRAYRPEMVPAWAGLPLGLTADIMSGMPLGVSGTLWPLVLLAHEVIDRRLMIRDAWADWLVTAVGVILVHLAQLVILNWLGGNSDQMYKSGLALTGLTLLVFPLVARICARIERRWLIG